MPDIDEQEVRNRDAQARAASRAQLEAGNSAGIRYGMIPWFSLFCGHGKEDRVTVAGVAGAGQNGSLRLLPKVPPPSNWLIKDITVVQKVNEASECSFKIYPRNPDQGRGAVRADRNILGSIIDDPRLEYGTPWAVAFGYHDPGLATYKYEIFRGTITAKKPVFSQGVNYMEVTLHSGLYWLQFLNGISTADMPDDYTRLTSHIATYPGLKDFVDIQIMENPDGGWANEESEQGGAQTQQVSTGGESQNLMQTVVDYAKKNAYVVCDLGPEIKVGPLISIARKKGTVYHPDDPEHEGPVFSSFSGEQTTWTLYNRVVLQWVQPYTSLGKQGQLKHTIRVTSRFDWNDPAVVASGIVPNGGDLIITNVPVQSEKEAAELVKKIHRGQIVWDTQASMQMRGTFIMLGDAITVKGREMGKAYQGEYFVQGATHTWSDDGYNVDLDLVKIPNFDMTSVVSAIPGQVSAPTFTPANKGATQ
ncbi:hypothetical protein IHN63_00450 [Deinococcus sp. 6YEL10]|uniref:hypothetical protein n=1 Tax=Deinococcus sp. 6YEL10 TaxID=2745870 RepID=UPI001E4CA0F2|nr:hypothetical protein [Deinococcus sp. 6YEL10]MCD0159769.1 hypothetical protein [Deinococcus sp. 6YEL10]